MVDTRQEAAIAFRPAAAGDAPALVAMINAAYRKSEGHVFPNTTRTGRTGVERILGELTVAIDAGRVVGSVHITLAPPRAHFGLLAVDVAMHGHGVGSRLVAHAEHVARDAGCAVMQIEVVEEGGGIPFYERLGYKVARRQRGQEWNGGDDWGAATEWHMVDMEKTL